MIKVHSGSIGKAVGPSLRRLLKSVVPLRGAPMQNVNSNGNVSIFRVSYFLFRVATGSQQWTTRHSEPGGRLDAKVAVQASVD